VGRKEAVGGLSPKEAGHQVERLRDTLQAIEPHRFDRFPYREVLRLRILLGSLADDVANAEFVEYASHTAEVIQDLAPVRALIGPHHLLCW
jgi:hypothetical protein